jgi:hypothetical protein
MVNSIAFSERIFKIFFLANSLFVLNTIYDLEIVAAVVAATAAAITHNFLMNSFYLLVANYLSTVLQIKEICEFKKHWRERVREGGRRESHKRKFFVV